ncbi:SURF1 family protein [Herminiimonas sp. CN]|uniref:SURF1 family protein n=1 Tax=Herminiimonas sp. CN TaxID=1349818 RepID=UPI000473712F|nr:SURF1 family protein [Herminiimonas sp. CN]
MSIWFRFRPVPFVATLLLMAVGIAAGQWQTRRAAEKQAIAAQLAQRAASPLLLVDARPLRIDEVEYRRISVSGEFLPNWPVYLDNRPYQGVAGLYVLMPFRIAGSKMHVLIARGWLPRNPADRKKLPAIPTPAGMITVQGVARGNPGRLLQLGQQDAVRPGAILQNLEVAGFAQASGLQLQPFVLEQSSALPDGLVRNWPQPSSGIDRHRGYAFQWFALSAMAFLFFVATGFRRGTKSAKA